MWGRCCVAPEKEHPRGGTAGAVSVVAKMAGREGLGSWGAVSVGERLETPPPNPRQMAVFLAKEVG